MTLPGIRYPARLKSSFSHIIDSSLDYLLPGHCLLCLEKTRHQSELCHYCTAQLIQNRQACHRCAVPLSTSETHFCGNCLSHKYYFQQVYSPFLYKDEIRYLVRQLKYHNKIQYARTLARLFIQHTEIFYDFQHPQLLIPMPMHKHRLKQRGYNQAQELTRFLSAHFQIPVNNQSLIRHQATRLQAGLNARDRQKNVSKAFKITADGRKFRLSDYQHIALVDDVMTTGSTLNEAARILKQAGIQRVDAWIMARA